MYTILCNCSENVAQTSNLPNRNRKSLRPIWYLLFTYLRHKQQERDIPDMSICCSKDLQKGRSMVVSSSEPCPIRMSCGRSIFSYCERLNWMFFKRLNQMSSGRSIETSCGSPLWSHLNQRNITHRKWQLLQVVEWYNQMLEILIWDSHYCLIHLK